MKELEGLISGCFYPIVPEAVLAEVSPNAEDEPSQVVNDWLCGGKLFHCERRRARSKNPSILGN